MKPTITTAAFGCLLVAAGVALFLARRDNAELSAQVTRLTRQNAGLRYELKQASQQATDIGQRAVELDSQLGSAKTRTTATETKNVRLARELSERERREVALMAELAALRQKTPVAGDETSRLRVGELETQLIQLLTRALAETPAEIPPTPEPPPARHQVVRVGPADTFVVLDYGAEHGARPEAIIRLQRGTSELAQVQISDVRPRFSLAQVLPDTLKGQLQTGDLVVFNP